MATTSRGSRGRPQGSRGRSPAGGSGDGGRPRRGRRAPRRGLGFGRAIAISLALLAFGAGVFATRAVLRLDRAVRERFEGRLFSVPTRVYSAPTILYAGLDLEEAGVRPALRRLGYRPEPELDSPGSYHAPDPSALRLHLRAFEHPTRPEPARRIELVLDGGQIEAIRDLETGRELAAAMLEPESVGAYFGPEHEQRELVRLGQVPRHLVDAILAVEDHRFEEHGGIDWVRVLGAAWANVRAGGIREGGSTLTQQLVKNFFLSPERTLERKLNEAAMAVIVEARYDKPAILEAYLNEIYLGQRGSTSIHGVGEAARFYFGKPVRQLRVEESALLAGLIHSPGNVNPFAHPEKARKRRDLVLSLMRDQERIDPATYEVAAASEIQLAPPSSERREPRYFLDALRLQLPEVYDREVLSTAGLRIYATLDLRLQERAAAAVREGLAELEKKYPALRPEKGPRLQACLVALRPQTGEVLALVGGRDYTASQYDRCTQARRQAGSAFKPFVYVAALEAERGAPLITLASVVDDGPLAIRTPSGTWAPANYDRRFHGRVPVREALERSFNVAAARLGQQVGIERVIGLARRLGIQSPLPAYPSLALGAADVTPIELARAYATLAAGGMRPEVRFFEDVTDDAGRTLERQRAGFERVLDPGVAYLSVSLLEGVMDRGTGRAVRAAGVVGPVAGKTGTTNDSKDAWFAGFTPEMVVVVWVGFDEPRGMRQPASQLALPIWQRFLVDVTGGRIRGSFVPPPEVRVAEVDPASGALALDGCPQRRPEYFLAGTEPRFTCPGESPPVFAGESWPLPEPSRANGADERYPRAPREPRNRRGNWLGRFVDRILGGDGG